MQRNLLNLSIKKSRLEEKDRPTQSLEPPWGRASRLQRCSCQGAGSVLNCYSNESSQLGYNFRLLLEDEAACSWRVPQTVVVVP